MDSDIADLFWDISLTPHAHALEFKCDKPEVLGNVSRMDTSLLASLSGGTEEDCVSVSVLEARGEGVTGREGGEVFTSLRLLNFDCFTSLCIAMGGSRAPQRRTHR